MSRRPSPRGVVGGAVPWTLIRIVAGLALVGTTGYDAGSVVWTRLQAEDAAARCAQSGSSTWQSTRSVRAAYGEAASSAEDRDLTIAPEEFVVESNGTVRVTLRGDAHTVVLRRIPRLRPWTVVRAEGSARTEAGARTEPGG